MVTLFQTELAVTYTCCFPMATYSFSNVIYIYIYIYIYYATKTGRVS